MPTNVVSQIQIPGGTVYDIKPSSNPNINTNGIYYVSASGTASAWTGTLTGLTEYYDGLKLVVYNNTGVASNAAFTLKLNSLSAIPVKRYGTTDGSAVSIAGVIYLCYVGGKFIESHYVNNTYNLQNVPVTINKPYIESTGIYTNSLVGHTTDGKMAPFTVTGGTGTGKNVTTYKFPIGQTLFIRKDAISAGQTTTYYDFYQAITFIDIRCCMCNWNASRVSMTTEVEYFMHVSVDHDAATFSPLKDTRTVNNIAINDHIVTKSLDRNELNAGNFYIHVGYRYYDNTSYPFYTSIDINNPLYYYDGTNLIEYEIWKIQQANPGFISENDALSPTAAMDIYASPEYPAIVCVCKEDMYTDLTQGTDPIMTSPSYVLSGHNLMYDCAVGLMYASGHPVINTDYGFALLIHDISMGQRVPSNYLLKRGNYPVHATEQDNTKQGSFNLPEVSSTHMILPSAYRGLDMILKDDVSTYVSNYPDTDGPIIYKMGYHEGSNLDGSIISGGYLTANRLTAYGPRTYAVVGKAVLDSNKELVSVDMDFTDDTIYSYTGFGGNDVSNDLTVVAINGNPIGATGNVSPGILPETILNNPVSGGGSNPVAGEDISPNTIVCLATDGFIYNVNSLAPGSESLNVVLDWGLAVYIGTFIAAQGYPIPQGTLVQQCTIPYEYPSGWSVSGVHTMCVLYPNCGNSGALSIVGQLSILDDIAQGYRDYRAYIYAGVADGSVLHVDFSNHDFIHLTPTDKVALINGRPLLGKEGGGDSSSSYDNPVSGDALNPRAGTRIPAHSFVIMGKDDGLLYPINYSEQLININLDWGAAYLTTETFEGDSPAVGTLLQQCAIPADDVSSLNIDVSNVTNNQQKTYYIRCTNVTTEYARLTDSSLPAASDELHKLETLLYVGTRYGSSSINVDFSNHDFLSMMDFNTNGTRITAINGRPVGISQPSVNLSHYESMLTSVKTITTADSSVLTLVIPTQGVWVVNAYATIDASGTSSSVRTVQARLATATNTSTAIGNCYAITGAKTCLGAANSSNCTQNISMQTIINVTTAPLRVHLIMKCSLARGANVAITSESNDIEGNPYATMISCFKIAEAQIQ